jgi:hypothetical protein
MFGRRSWRFTTALSPSQCGERLRSAIDDDFSFLGLKPVTGRVRAQGAILRKRLLFRTPYQMVVRVDFQPSAVACEARLDWFSAIFAVAWSGFLVLIGGLFTILMLGGAVTPAPGVPLIVAIAMPLGVIALAALLPWLGYRSASRHAAFVADFVRALLAEANGTPAADDRKLEKAS